MDEGDGLVDGAGEGGVVEGEKELDAADGLGGCVGRGDLAGLPGVTAEVEGYGVAGRMSEGGRLCNRAMGTHTPVAWMAAKSVCQVA